MSDETRLHSGNLERFRQYLALLARLQMPLKLRSKLDASDMVQETLLKAQQHLHNFRGGDDVALAGWLRTILANTMRDAKRHFDGDKRGVHREQSLEERLLESSARLDRLLAETATSPSGKFARQEEFLRVVDAISQLPADQRTAVELHHLQGCTLAEIAGHMDRTERAVAGLLRRGLKTLRDQALTSES